MLSDDGPVFGGVSRSILLAAAADAELFQQLALFGPGKAALLDAAAIVNPALETVVAAGLSDEARRTAQVVLNLLTASEPALPINAHGLHVMVKTHKNTTTQMMLH